MRLSDQQLDTVAGSLQRVKESGECSIAGLAGTGKTTIVKTIVNRLKEDRVSYCVLTPTGKAANVLRQKGVNADTIHSAIYNYKGKYVDDRGNDNINWEEKGEIEDTPDVVIIDEASMVDAFVAADLRRLGVKILWVGDHGQLPPVGRDPGIMRHPDYILTEVFRQKGNAGLLDYAYDVRSGALNRSNYDNVTFVNSKIAELAKLDFDQAICGFNASRAEFNKYYRKHRGMRMIAEKGERMICIHNNRRQGLFNGMQFKIDEVVGIGLDAIEAIITIDGTDVKKQVSIAKENIGKVKYNTEVEDKQLILADYAYCITCHKSQGSEWQNVLVMNQACQAWDQTRWLYTAATRASQKLIIA